MAQRTDYYYEKKRLMKVKLEELKEKLPVYTHPFLEDKELTIQISSVVGYAYDLSIFFKYLQEKNPLCKGLNIKDIPYDVVSSLTYADINEYQRYLKQSNSHENGVKSIARKLAPLRGFYKYQCIHGEMTSDPTIGAAKSKTKNRDEVVYMNSEEVNEFIGTIQYSNVKSARQRLFCEKAQYRDTALAMLMLKTGIRVSECVGIDIDDIAFSAKSVRIIRKGGFSRVVYFDDETANCLKEYIEFERNPSLPEGSEEMALFLSNRKKRISVRAVEDIIKKFAKESVPDKKITPHKLRSSFGSALYAATGDLYLVATALDHMDVNTSKIYVKQKERENVAKHDVYGRNSQKN